MSRISEKLIPWYEENHRELPFRQNAVPYNIWVSEIMAQQTRIEAMLPKYALFMETFPDLKSLADAPEEVLQKVWQGLGYYSRARNMKKCARVLMEEYGGKFPEIKKELMELPGIGDYTAGAIASICFQENVPAVDGNVIRVFSRLYALDEDFSKSAGKKKLAALVEDNLPGSEGISAFNQGLMELGALVCIPSSPRCLLCPLQEECQAFLQGRQNDFPVPRQKKPRRIEHPVFSIWVCLEKQEMKVRMVRRPEKALLAGLYGFDETLPAPEQVVNTAPFIDSRHVFSHIEWQSSSRIFYVRQAGEDFYSLQQIEQALAVPSAFMPFVDALKKKEEELYGTCRH